MVQSKSCIEHEKETVWGAGMRWPVGGDGAKRTPQVLFLGKGNGD